MADLRRLQGFLASVDREHVVSSLNPGDEALSAFAERQAVEVGRIAEQIEQELGQKEP